MFSGRPKSLFLVKISSTRLIKRLFPALKLINPPITEYSLSSFSTNSTIALAIIGGAIFALRASDETFTAKSPNSGFFGFSTDKVPFAYSVICPNLFAATACSMAFSILFIK